MNVPLLDLKEQNAKLRPEIEAALGRVLDTNGFILGGEVAELEKELAYYCGTKYAIGCASGSDAILLALQVDFAGDRVAAFINGLGGMLNAAFENKTEFFMLDGLEAQKFYNSARNVEIAAWKLSNARDAAGNLLLLSNEMNAPPLVSNLSFEREFGKMIAHLDVMTIALADRSNRTISRVAQTIASAVFLPVAIK